MTPLDPTKPARIDQPARALTSQKLQVNVVNEADTWSNWRSLNARLNSPTTTTSIDPHPATQWYREAIPLAEQQRYERYLKERRDEEEHQR